jgi:3',5'-cyclic AMP phosphodiesterase CpdA
MSPRRDDWLILAGDLGETPDDLAFVFSTLGSRFAKLVWVPGNHELWSVPQAPRRGVAKYEQMVDVAMAHRVVTPEDPYEVFESDGRAAAIAPLFVLYDYSFRPDDVPFERAVEWADESGVLCVDEELLHPDPYPSRQAWCQARVRATEERLMTLPADIPSVLVNHFPLRREHAVLPAIPRFSIWCGTRATEEWHERFRASLVLTGHLHIRATRRLAGTRFEEVSLGYSRQRPRDSNIDDYVRLGDPFGEPHRD